ncbi:MAG: acetyl-CoA hydrolase/transferase C-terminal domain-containing protein [Rhodomicrobiaceae bacterium]
MPAIHKDVSRCADAILAAVGPNIVLGLPIGIGKANHIVNELFARAMKDRSLRLTIFSGLTLVKPSGGNELQKRFAGPLVERLFGGYPDLDYALAQKRGELPANIQVHEFFLQAGAMLSSPSAQQSYVSLNYTHVARHLLNLGVNVIAQLVAPAADGKSYSLSGNTDMTLDVLPELARRRDAGQKIAIAGQANRALPFMTGDAEISASAFDHILDDPAYEFPLFAPPKQPVSAADYAAALHVVPTIKDGGTIQLGIGAFGDALTHILKLRHERNEEFRELVTSLGVGHNCPHLPLELAPFEKGLYGASEMFVDGFLELYRAGILKRRVFDNVEQQQLADDGGMTAEDYLKGAVLHAGFFVGSTGFYEGLHTLDDEGRAALRMTAISFINQLYGGEELRRAHRKHGRFINSAMMATLKGALVSDQLDDGGVVSGVGGQYNFVAQAHELDDARAIIEVKAIRMSGGKPRSNIRWNYGAQTIPAHLRDMIVTEHGLADLRGLSDRDCIAAMLNLADSRFQDGLLARAKKAGKIEKDHAVPESFRRNYPERVEALLAPAFASGLLVEYPLGSQMTEVEQSLARALGNLRDIAPSWTKLAGMVARGGIFRAPGEAEREALLRMNLDAPSSLKERALAVLVTSALRATAKDGAG